MADTAPPIMVVLPPAILYYNLSQPKNLWVTRTFDVLQTLLIKIAVCFVHTIPTFDATTKISTPIGTNFSKVVSVHGSYHYKSKKVFK